MKPGTMFVSRGERPREERRVRTRSVFSRGREREMGSRGDGGAVVLCGGGWLVRAGRGGGFFVWKKRSDWGGRGRMLLMVLFYLFFSFRGGRLFLGG